MNRQYFFQSIILEAERNDFLSASNIFAFCAILISVASIFISYRTIFKSKVLDLKFHKFENLCLKNINSILKTTDDIFNLKHQDMIDQHLQIITETITELQSFLVSLKKTTYNDIDMDKLIEITEIFTDKTYTNTDKVLNNKSDYLIMKLNLNKELYKYASLVEMIFILTKHSI
jgi:hypothetical protein